ncbi:peptide-methionine (S)-S-oxide reductase MsrA [Candidatus Woesearchaeota archaeon]|nr:peptide-methionine (S)-S-oxide reductase MsrA [Candidatus Woesearchaeota archaeon]
MVRQKTQLATFAAGCFWHVEESFRQMNGVVKTTVGYIGGHMENPTYKNVCSDETGYAEAVQVEFDPKQISYEELLGKFWEIHDPTSYHKQGPDVGSQYRAAIFYHDEKQKQAAMKSKNKLSKSEKYKNKKIVTEIVKASKFYPAEEYHQKYFQKHKLQKFFACQ